MSSSHSYVAQRNHALFQIILGLMYTVFGALCITTIIVNSRLHPTWLVITLILSGLAFLSQAILHFDNAWPWIEKHLDEMFD